MVSFQLNTHAGGKIVAPENTLEFKWSANWENLLGDQSDPRGVPNHAKAIDSYLSRDLRTIPRKWFPPIGGSEPFLNLAIVTLLRGVEYQLPSAQDLSAGLSVSTSSNTLPILDSDQLLDGCFRGGGQLALKELLQKYDLHKSTPLWLYCLLEAGHCHGGQRLGPFATRIVVETIHAAIEASASGAIEHGLVEGFDRKACAVTRKMCTLYDIVDVAKNWTPAQT